MKHDILVCNYFDHSTEYPKEVNKILTELSALVPFWHKKKVEALGERLFELHRKHTIKTTIKRDEIPYS